ncbi:MAG: hypothetical protein GXY41_04565 [Phycisphaerae bacterium]|nr:hypothetical protein [Phycisphaerae bacterium]
MKISNTIGWGVAVAVLVAAAVFTAGCDRDKDGQAVTLLNVSYDPTRELYQDFNKYIFPHTTQCFAKTI